jgi:hypothetical protein
VEIAIIQLADGDLPTTAPLVRLVTWDSITFF